jgi:hypothetical protein
MIIFIYQTGPNRVCLKLSIFLQKPFENQLWPSAFLCCVILVVTKEHRSKTCLAKGWEQLLLHIMSLECAINIMQMLLKKRKNVIGYRPRSSNYTLIYYYFAPRKKFHTRWNMFSCLLIHKRNKTQVYKNGLAFQLKIILKVYQTINFPLAFSQKTSMHWTQCASTLDVTILNIEEIFYY